LDRFYDSHLGEIRVMTSGKVKNELTGTNWEGQFEALDGSKLREEKFLNVFQQYGVYLFTTASK
jgi:hypothetical protein